MMPMTGDELRRRVDRLGLTYREAAEALGLSLAGLNHQMRGVRSVSRQTEMLLERIEADRERAVRHTEAGPR
jgi:transcriptional regulator with XRE-family HTH domain